MTTRAQLQFRDEYSKAQVYVHGDGYPDGYNGIISVLKDFYKWNDKRNTDASYTAANFIYYEKVMHSGSVMDYGMRHELETSGLGVEEVGKIHGDERYLYIIHMNTENWVIEIAHLGPIDGKEITAFDEAQFTEKGTLDELYKKYVDPKYEIPEKALPPD